MSGRIVKPFPWLVDPSRTERPDLWRGAELSIAPNIAGRFRDIVAGVEPVVLNPSNVTDSVVERGPTPYIGDAQLEFPANARYTLYGDEDFTVVMHMHSEATNTTLWSYRNSGALSNGAETLYKDAGASPKNHYFATRVGGGNFFATFASVVDDMIGDRVYVFRRKKGGTYSFFVNGVEYTATQATTPPTTPQVLNVLGNLSGTTSVGRYGHLHSFTVWKQRALSNEEILEITADPFIMFRELQSMWPAFDLGSTNYPLSIETGSHIVTGNDLGLHHGQYVSTESGSYTNTGTDVGLSYGQSISMESGSYIVTQQSIDFDLAVSATEGIYTVSGSDLSTTVGYAITHTSGSYSLTGQDIGLTASASPVLVSDSGSYTSTGTDVGLLVGYNSLIDSGSYSVSGTDIGMLVSYNISVETGSYTTTGTDVSLLVSHYVDLLSGSIDVAGQDVTLSNLPVLVTQTGSYTTTGTDLALEYDRIVVLDSGSVDSAGTDITLSSGNYIGISTDSYSTSGNPISLLVDRIIEASSGSIVHTGVDTSLYRGYTGVFGSDSYTIAGSGISIYYNRSIVIDTTGYVISGNQLTFTADVEVYVMNVDVTFVPDLEISSQFVPDLSTKVNFIK